MKEMILANFWRSLGARFGEENGASLVLDFGDVDAELYAIRNSVSLADFSFAEKFVLPETEGIDALDEKLSANAMKLRYGRVLDSFLADVDGKIRAEVFAAYMEDGILVIAESIKGSVADDFRSCVNFEDLSDSVLLSLDGPESWRVAKAVFGSDILNLTFLSAENYSFEGERVRVLRNGRTGEFGYWFVVPASKAESFAERLMQEVRALGGCACGFNAQVAARIGGNFFNVYREGAAVATPLALGLQWQIDFEKEFCGSQKIFESREAGLAQKVLAIVSDSPLESGADLFDESECVGKIVSVSPAKICGKFAGLALINVTKAFSGLDFSDKANAQIQTVSRPMFIAESLKRPMDI